MKLSRRRFLQSLAAGTVATAIPIRLLADEWDYTIINFERVRDATSFDTLYRGLAQLNREVDGRLHASYFCYKGNANDASLPSDMDGYIKSHFKKKLGVEV